MLDNRSLDVISKFKFALLTKSQETESTLVISRLNRGKKLPEKSTKPQTLQPKIVDYEGSDRLVLTNDAIERSNYRNKRRWLDYNRLETGKPESNESSSEEDYSSQDSEYSEDEEDGNPLKKIKIGELLAPLSHPSEVVTHPAISKTYRLPCLSNLASELIEVIEVEQNTLNNLNKLLRVLNGEDWFFFLEDKLGLPLYDHGLDDTKKEGSSSSDTEHLDRLEKIEIQSTTALDAADTPPTDAQTEDEKFSAEDPFFSIPKTLAKYEMQQIRQMEEAKEDEDELEIVQQDLINFLQVSIQRQHEYIKNLQNVRMGVVGADRYKNDLYRWGKEMCEKK